MAKLRPFMGYTNFNNVSKGRIFLNKELLPRFAYGCPDGSEILFVGCHPYWDYSPFFNHPGKLCNYRTLDKHPGGGNQPKPDFNLSIEDCHTIEDNTFDGIIMIGVYEFLDHPEKAFSEINRILKPGGRALISVPGKGYYPDGKRSVHPWQVWEKFSPLTIQEVYVTHEKGKEPTAIHVICQKGAADENINS